MENVFHSTLTNAQISKVLRVRLTYCSIVLFVLLASFISISVHRYVGKTLATSIIALEISEAQALKTAEEEIPEESSVSLAVKKGDTLNTILKGQNLPNSDIGQILSLIKNKNINPSLKHGKQITFDYEIKIIESDDNDLTEETRTLTKLTIAIDKTNSLEIIREGDDFIAKNTSIKLNKFLTKTSVVIGTNFMSALKSIGLTTNSIIQLINSYSYQIDFQRQIQAGDTATVILEKFATEDGDFSHYGKILYASLNLSGKEYNIYNYSHNNSHDNHSFFSENGKSVKRSLLRTPVNLVRISSNYGNRMHPTLGFTKMHKGIDFAAPTGTPIYAAGHGVISEIGWKSGYGNFVQIKHSPTLSTAYAHASKFAKNLKPGSTVKQGQVIAYVGSTGRATGAHLHYEVKIDGKHVNPMSIKTTPGIELTGTQLTKFGQFKKKINLLVNKLDKNIEIAENSVNSLN